MQKYQAIKEGRRKEMNANISTHEKKGDYSLKVLNPVGILNFKHIPPAKRLKDLKSKKIGLYWNHKARGDVALKRVKELLSERFEEMGFEWFETEPSEIPSKTLETSEKFFESVRKSGVQGVVSSTGD